MRGIDLKRRTFLMLLAPLRRLRAQISGSKLKPDADDFPSEVLHDRIAAILALWTPLRADAVARSLSANFQGASLVPAESKILRPGASLEVRRMAYPARASLDRAAFAKKFDAWLSPFTEIHVADFQITAIEGARTRVRYEIVGSGPGFHREQRIGCWQLEWRGDLIERWVAEPETRSRATHPWFAEITHQSLGQLPELRGVDYWRTVLDGASGIDIYGHNGVSVGDIDNSGFDSIYVCQPAGLPNRLYRNRGDGTFEDITAGSGVDLLDNTACALFADFTNSGRQDLLVVRATGPLLFVNQGNGRFAAKPDAFRFATPPQGTFTGAAAADYDSDGWIDVYFCLYTFYQGAGQYNYPTPYFAAENGPPNYLMRSNRDGTFRDATRESGLDVDNTRFSFCCAWGDFNNDGHPDLYVVNDFGRKNLYRNNGDGTFTDIAAQAGVEDVGAGMSVAWLDRDLYVANMWTAAGERLTAQPEFQHDVARAVRTLYRKHAMGNSLFRNRGDGTFENATVFEGGGMGRWAWSSDSWDFDHDGYPDLYIANGMISGPDKADLNSFFWRQVVGNSPDEARPSQDYEQGWSAINDLIRSDATWSGYERNVFYASNRDGTYADVSGAVGLDFIEDGRAFALADFDHDGRVEVLVKSRNSPELRLMKNVAPELAPSIAFQLTGRVIGAAITVGHQTKRIQAGSGFLSQHSKEIVFGLGDAKGPLTATIRWPSGATQRLEGLPANHRIKVAEGNAKPILEAFRNSADLVRAKPQAAVPLPTAIETWLLSPVPDMPPGDMRNILFRHLFDRRRDIAEPASFLRNEAGEIVKVYQGPVSAHKLEADRKLIPTTPEERLALALPYKGNAATYTYGRNHLSLGSVYFEKGYLEPAETFFRMALRDDPVSAEAHYGIGSVALKRNQIPEARVAFEQALRLNPAYSDTGPNAWNNLGLIATREGRMDEAVRCFREALKLSPDYWISLENLGNAYRQTGLPNDARPLLERLVELRPRDPVANYSLGMVFAQIDNAKQAEELLDRALSLKPDYPEALNNLGILCLRTGRRDEAVARFEQCIRIAPAFEQAYANLARVYDLEGAQDKAQAVRDALRKAKP
jgi:Flp pilus assembly protein TadD